MYKTDSNAAKTSENETAETGDASAAATAPAKTVQPKLTVHKADFEKDVIYLYQFSRTPFLPSISPYCLKVETWLRLAGLKYEVFLFEFFFGLFFLLSFLLILVINLLAIYTTCNQKYKLIHIVYVFKYVNMYPTLSQYILYKFAFEIYTYIH